MSRSLFSHSSFHRYHCYLYIYFWCKGPRTFCFVFTCLSRTLSSGAMVIEDWTSIQDFHHACTTLPLPTLLDDIAARRPDRPFVPLPINNDDLSHGYQDFTYSDFARSVDRCAWWIVDKLGRCGCENARSETRTLAYVGPQDVRCAVLLFGAVRGFIGSVSSICEESLPLKEEWAW